MEMETKMSFYEPELKKALTILENVSRFPLSIRGEIERLSNDLLEGTEKGIEQIIACMNKRGHTSGFGIKQHANPDDKKFVAFIISYTFLNGVRDAVRDLLNTLDSRRDSEKEVEFAIRFFPRELSRAIRSFDNKSYEYPVVFTQRDSNVYRNRNTYAIPFVPLLARLGTEIGEMRPEERGGLLGDTGTNGLRELMLSSDKDVSPEQNRLEDGCCLDALKRLRASDLLRKNDVQKYQLLHCLCEQRTLFATRRFQYLCDWDPPALLSVDGYNRQPLNAVAMYSTFEGFGVVLKAGIEKLSLAIGIRMLFRKPSLCETLHRVGGLHQCTPFQNACRRHGTDRVVNLIQKIVADNWDGPCQAKNLLMSSSIDKTTHTDAIYFLLHLNPSILR